MTVKDLKKKLRYLQDDVKIGGIGHYGEFLECWDISVKEVYNSQGSEPVERILAISIESPGPDPD